MRFLPVVALALSACSASALSEPDNPDALGDIPAAPPTESRDDRENPYDDEDDGSVDSDDIDDEPIEDEPVDDEPLEDDPVVDEPIDPAPPTVPDPATPAPPTPDPVTPSCPSGMTCVDSFPFIDSATTTGGASNLDGYGCAPSTNESGPEQVYEVTLPDDGFLAITLFGLGAGVDVDAHLLETTDVDTCIDRGHWDAASLLPAGTYTVVIDSWVDSAGNAYDGDYTVRFNHTAYDEYAGDGLAPIVMQRALTAFDIAWHDGETSKLVYTVADFDLPSTTPRLWTFNLANGQLLYNELVTHGENSSSPTNPAMVAEMSNVNNSHMSSLGLMRTSNTYQGSNGYSMRLDGLEPGYNDLVRPRAIVMHEATYATQSFVDSVGYLGRSWGCPAVDPQINAALIDTIKEGSLFFSHFSDPAWLNGSDFL